MAARTYVQYNGNACTRGEQRYEMGFNLDVCRKKTFILTSCLSLSSCRVSPFAKLFLVVQRGAQLLLERNLAYFLKAPTTVPAVLVHI